MTGSDRQLALMFQINRLALAQAQALDGRYLLGTNAPHLSASQTLTFFKGQDRVEKCRHAYLKGPLCVRPLFLHSDERIEGLVFITLLALLVGSLLELHCRRTGLRLSAERFLHTFASFHATHQTFVDGSQYQHLGKLTTPQQKILDLLHFPPPSRYLSPLPG